MKSEFEENVRNLSICRTTIPLVRVVLAHHVETFRAILLLLSSRKGNPTLLATSLLFWHNSHATIISPAPHLASLDRVQENQAKQLRGEL